MGFLPGDLRFYSGQPTVSSSTHGRTLTVPLGWERQRVNSAAVPEIGEVRHVSDENLMASIQEQDASSFSALFGRYSRLVFSIALRILGDHSEAEEIVQEAFLYVYKKALLFDPAKGSAKGWIVQVAYNRALDRKSHLVRRGYYSGTDIDSLDDTLLGKVDTEREIGARLDCARLQQAFEELTQVQRRTLELFYFEGLELSEISQQTDETLGNVRHHFYRGLERLRKSVFLQQLRPK